jgi:hypothetical protein
MRSTLILGISLALVALGLSGCRRYQSARSEAKKAAVIKAVNAERNSKAQPDKDGKAQPVNDRKDEPQANNPGQKGPPPAAAPKKEDRLLWAAEAFGWGADEQDALKTALQNAAAEVKEYLKKQKPVIAFAPSEEYIRTRLLRGKDGVNGKGERFQEKDLNQFSKKCWKWTVQITESEFEKLRQEDQQLRLSELRKAREERMDERMLFLGKIIGGLVLLLGGVAGYIWLDDYSTGAYKGMLRLAGLAVLGALAAGLVLS